LDTLNEASVDYIERGASVGYLERGERWFSLNHTLTLPLLQMLVCSNRLAACRGIHAVRAQADGWMLRETKMEEMRMLFR
jgi:hypothetical protein